MSEVQNAAETPEVPAAEAQQPASPSQESNNQLPEGIMRRFGELTAARRAAEEEAARARAELEQLRAQAQAQNQQPEQNVPQIPLNNANVEQLIEQMAEQRLAQRLAAQQVQEKVKSIETAGREKYGDDFDRSVTNLQMTGIGGQGFIDALTSVKGSEAVVRYLGDTANLDEAMRIASLPPVQMALAMSELAPKAAKQYAKPISSAPSPMSTVDGARGNNPGAEPDPKDTKAWMQWRRDNARRR